MKNGDFGLSLIRTKETYGMNRLRCPNRANKLVSGLLVPKERTYEVGFGLNRTKRIYKVKQVIFANRT